MRAAARAVVPARSSSRRPARSRACPARAASRGRRSGPRRRAAARAPHRPGSRCRARAAHPLAEVEGGRAAVRRAARARRAAARRGRHVLHLGPDPRDDPEPRLAALGHRPADPDDAAGRPPLPAREPGRAAAHDRRPQPAARRRLRAAVRRARARLAPERARHRHLLPAPRPQGARARRGRARSTSGSRRSSSTCSWRPARRRCSSARASTCAGRGGWSRRSCTTTTTSTCGCGAEATGRSRACARPHRLVLRVVRVRVDRRRVALAELGRVLDADLALVDEVEPPSS